MTPIKNFPQSPPPGLVDALAAAGIDYRNEGGVWLASDAHAAELIAATYNPEAHVKREKAALLAELRWQRETSGFMFQPEKADRPYRFKSTRDAMPPILALAVFALMGNAKPRRWKTDEVDEKGNAIFVTIEAQDIGPFAEAFGAHVEAAFIEEETKGAQVKDADWRDVEPITIEAAIADKA